MSIDAYSTRSNAKLRATMHVKSVLYMRVMTFRELHLFSVLNVDEPSIVSCKARVRLIRHSFYSLSLCAKNKMHYVYLNTMYFC